jgi:cysteine/O-acetylserine efflux protein
MYNKETDVISFISDIITYEMKGGLKMPLFSFLVFVIITSFTPGPNNIMAMTFANKHGLTKTFPFCFGVGVGFLVITGLSSFFNIFLTKIMPIIEYPLIILGVSYMLYLAFKILTNKENGSDKEEENIRNLFLVGVILQFVNPKGILFGITVVATYILPYYSSYLSYFLFSLFLGIVGVFSTFSWALFGSAFQKILQQYQQPFNIVMALLLVYSALSILIHS